MAERALGSGQGLAAPPMLPGKRFAAYRKAVATPSHSAALLCLSFWDTPPSSAWPVPFSLCPARCQCVCSISHYRAQPPALGLISASSAYSFCKCHQAPHKISVKHPTRIVRQGAIDIWGRKVLQRGGAGCSGHCRMFSSIPGP